MVDREEVPSKTDRREVWHSQVAFIFASLGCAVGYGNIWRFPMLAYEYGGGAFFLPYFLALVFIGLPLLVLELSLGQYHNTCDIGVFGSIDKRLRGIGLSTSLNSFIVVCFYAMLIAWTIRSFLSTFASPQSWSLRDGEEAFSYFLNKIVGMETLDDHGSDYSSSALLTRIVFPNVLCLLLVWVCIFLGTAFGLEWTGKISYITMGIPIVAMIALLVRAITLPGAGQGIKAYIGEWDWSILIEHPDVWSAAVSQTFFSLGVTFGMFTAFGSHCDSDSTDAYRNSITIGLCNSAFAIISGFSIFGALGYLAQQEQVDISEVFVGGPALIFGVYPDVLETLPWGLFWVQLLFFGLFLLGIDTAFSIVEAIVTVLLDTSWLCSYSHRQVSGGVCLMGFLCGLLYATDAGLTFLDVIDFYINFIMILVGLLECIAIGWLYGMKNQIKTLGSRDAVLIYMATSFGSVTAASFFWFSLKNPFAAFFTSLLVWASLYVAGTQIAYLYSDPVRVEGQDAWTIQTVTKELMFSNSLQLKTELECAVGYFPLWVAVLVKHVIPHVLYISIINLAIAKGEDGEILFGHYGAYSLPFQILGMAVVALSCLIIGLGALVPSVFDNFESYDHVEYSLNKKSKGKSSRRRKPRRTFRSTYEMMP